MSKLIDNLKELFDIAWELNKSDNTKTSITQKIIDCVPKAIQDLDYYESIKNRKHVQLTKELVVKLKHIPYPDYNCPVCDHKISNPKFTDGYMPNVCSNCGQIIIRPSINYPLEN